LAVPLDRLVVVPVPRCPRFGKIAALLAALALVLAVVAAGSAAPASGQSSFEVVASGLDSPRHLSFSPTGALYVVEAGRGGSGPCVPHPLGEFCLGFSGAVTQVRDNGPDQRVLTGVPSIVNPADGETLGPSDIAFTGSQKFVLSVGIGGSDEFRAGFGAQGALLGTLVTGKLKHGGFSLFADVLANEAVANPDGTDIDSNPVGLVRQGEGYIVADAGANAVVRASHKGRFTTITALPPTSIGADAVPTSVVKGPDGAYYISQLTGFPFQPGAANIWRVVPGQAPTVFASGLTNLTDLAFGPDGSLYAVEIASAGLLNGPIGALKRITPGSSQHTTVVGDLFAPYGVALTRSSAYVSTCAVCAGGGEVIKISLD
jgi:hypothetical protein